MTINQRDGDALCDTVVRLAGGSVRFSPGHLLATPGAMTTLARRGLAPHQLLLRHLRGDWGDVPADDARLNDQALMRGERLLSAYDIGGDERIWVITEADRSATTVLLPSEY